MTEIFADDPFAQPTIMPLISYLVGISGQPPSLIRYGVTLLSGFPIGVAYRFIPREQILAKHLLSIITTIAMFMLAFNVAGLLHVLAAGTYVWLITRFYGTKLLSPIMCFVILMIHLSYVHFVAQILRLDDPSFVDSSAPMMVLVMKLSSFAWSVYDGSKPPKELNTDQKTYAVTEHPSLVSYFGYCLFFCGVWIGPAFEFKTYDQFITEKGQFEKQRISLVHMAQVLAIALVALGINLYLSPTVHYRHCTESFFREEFSFIQR